jgi:hypothetical protein
MNQVLTGDWLEALEMYVDLCRTMRAVPYESPEMAMERAIRERYGKDAVIVK